MGVGLEKYVCEDKDMRAFGLEQATKETLSADYFLESSAHIWISKKKLFVPGTPNPKPSHTRCCPCPPRGPENPRDFKEVKCRPETRFRESLKVGQN